MNIEFKEQTSHPLPVSIVIDKGSNKVVGIGVGNKEDKRVLTIAEAKEMVSSLSAALNTVTPLPAHPIPRDDGFLYINPRKHLIQYLKSDGGYSTLQHSQYRFKPL